jgi:hypothetical protein
VSYPTADDTLLEEINNMYQHTLDVPPSTMNRLGEDEFATSAITSNIILANKIRMYQRVFKAFVARIIKTHIKYSPYIQDTLKEILNNASTASTEDPQKLSLDERLIATVRGIALVLSPPDISQIKAQSEETNDYISVVETIVEAMYPDDMTDRDNEDTVKIIRAYLKKQLIEKHLAENHVLGGIGIAEMKDLDIGELVKNNLVIKNIATAIKQTMDATNADDSGNSSGGGW